MITAKKCRVQSHPGTPVPYKEGVLACKIVDLADILSLMDGATTFNVVAMNAGDVIVGVEVHVNVPLGEVGEFILGADANLHSSADADGFLKAMDFNVANVYFSTSDSVADETAITFCGALMNVGRHVCLADGYITGLSGADNTDTSALTGSIKVWYLPG